MMKLTHGLNHFCLAFFGVILLPALAFGSAFEPHSSYQQEPWLETEKGISLSKSVLEMGMGFRFLKDENFFNTKGNIDQSPRHHQIMTWDIFWRYGFTENWTWWANIPIVWSDQSELSFDTGSWEDTRSSEMEIGDAETGILYQFFRKNDPTLSMGLALRWKVPTGREAPGKRDANITGTGTTDVELSYLGRYQLPFEYLSIGWAAGYNIRFPGVVQYLSDQNTSITNASLDLGDEIFGRVDVIGGFEYVALQIIAEFRYRLETEVAMPEFRAELVSWTNPKTGAEEEAEYLLYNGSTYHSWDVPEEIDPEGSKGNLVSSSGYLLTITPRVIVRPLDWVDVTFFVKIHVIGKNTIFLTDKDNNNDSFYNFMPMQALGFDLGGMVLGELGVHTTIRW